MAEEFVPGPVPDARPDGLEAYMALSPNKRAHPPREEIVSQELLNSLAPPQPKKKKKKTAPAEISRDVYQEAPDPVQTLGVRLRPDDAMSPHVPRSMAVGRSNFQKPSSAHQQRFVEQQPRPGQGDPSWLTSPLHNKLSHILICVLLRLLCRPAR